MAVPMKQGTMYAEFKGYNIEVMVRDNSRGGMKIYLVVDDVTEDFCEPKGNTTMSTDVDGNTIKVTYAQGGFFSSATVEIFFNDRSLRKQSLDDGFLRDILGYSNWDPM